METRILMLPPPEWIQIEDLFGQHLWVTLSWKGWLARPTGMRLIGFERIGTTDRFLGRCPGVSLVYFAMDAHRWPGFPYGQRAPVPDFPAKLSARYDMLVTLGMIKPT